MQRQPSMDSTSMRWRNNSDDEEGEDAMSVAQRAGHSDSDTGSEHDDDDDDNDDTVSLASHAMPSARTNVAAAAAIAVAAMGAPPRLEVRRSGSLLRF